MNILAITRHVHLVERLRMAFEGAGHRVIHVQDQLQALAAEAWSQAQIILVDRAGDPLDGYRFCGLLRGEVRSLFHNLGIFLVLDGAPGDEDFEKLRDCNGDGFISHDQSLQELLENLGPAVGGELALPNGPQLPVVASGISKPQLRGLQSLLQHFHFDLHSCAAKDVRQTLVDFHSSILLLGSEAEGTRALATLRRIRAQGELPYVILLGPTPSDDAQRQLFMAGVADWLPLPLSEPRLLHACRRAMEWLHARKIKREFEQKLNELRERRVLLEMEAASLRNEVLTDPLTGLLNRRAFDQNLEHALRQWERHHRSFVLILADVDHFKLVNDRFGHLVGDQVLQGLAQRLRNALRRSDLAFRIGGEEFAVILPETAIKAGTEVAEKLRRRIDQEPLTLDSGQSIFPTMSFGVGVPGADSAAQLFAQVDLALYRAKNSGRNAVEVVGSPLKAGR
jgi:diguanylate cyclase (GGDEF)-like protein